MRGLWCGTRCGGEAGTRGLWCHIHVTMTTFVRMQSTSHDSDSLQQPTHLSNNMQCATTHLTALTHCDLHLHWAPGLLRRRRLSFCCDAAAATPAYRREGCTHTSTPQPMYESMLQLQPVTISSHRLVLPKLARVLPAPRAGTQGPYHGSPSRLSVCTTPRKPLPTVSLFSVERFTGKETGRDRPAGVQSPTSTGKHQHHQRPKPSEPQPQTCTHASVCVHAVLLPLRRHPRPSCGIIAHLTSLALGLSDAQLYRNSPDLETVAKDSMRKLHRAAP